MLRYNRLFLTFSNHKRYLSSKKRSHQNYKDRINRQFNIGEANQLPEFNYLIKSFYKKAHPDIIRSHNQQYANENDIAFQQLNSIISTIKTNEFPPLISKTILFHMKSNDHNSTFKQVNLTIRTSGGDCKKSLSKQFQVFVIYSTYCVHVRTIYNICTTYNICTIYNVYTYYTMYALCTMYILIIRNVYTLYTGVF